MTRDEAVAELLRVWDERASSRPGRDAWPWLHEAIGALRAAPAIDVEAIKRQGAEEERAAVEEMIQRMRDAAEAELAKQGTSMNREWLTGRTDACNALLFGLKHRDAPAPSREEPR